MAAPPSTPQQRIDFRIPDLPALPADADPAGLLDAVYDYATNKTYRRPASLGGGTLAANAVRGARKIVRFKYSNWFGVPADASTLDRLPLNTLCVGTEALVLNPAGAPGLNTAPPAIFVLVRQAAADAGTLAVALDADPATTATAPCRWLATDDPDAVAPTLAYLTPEVRLNTVYEGDTYKYEVGGGVRIFEAAQDLNPEVIFVVVDGNQLVPAPTGEDDDIYWTEISPQLNNGRPAVIDLLLTELYDALDPQGGSGQRLYTDQLYRVTNATGGDVYFWAMGPHLITAEQEQGGIPGMLDVVTGVFTARPAGSGATPYDGIRDGVTATAPTENAVFDALATKQDSTGWHSRISSGTAAVGSGSKSFTVGLGLFWAAGHRWRLDHPTNGAFLAGTVTSYDRTTGAFVGAVDGFSGSGSIGAGGFLSPGLPIRVVAGTNVSIDNTNPYAPVISSTGGAASFASLTGAPGDNGALATALAGKQNVDALSALTYAGTLNLDFTADNIRTVTLAGNLTLTTSNRATGRQKIVRIIGDGSVRTLTFPAGWKFVGAVRPAQLAASKIGVLSLFCFGTTDADIVASWAPEL